LPVDTQAHASGVGQLVHARGKSCFGWIMQRRRPELGRQQRRLPTPVTATSLALTITASRPISCPVKVIGSVAATRVPPAISMAQACSPHTRPQPQLWWWWRQCGQQPGQQVRRKLPVRKGRAPLRLLGGRFRRLAPPPVHCPTGA
jgi:hypothetical protein